jgi:predicted RNase H-like HicB family nuclease
MTKDWVRAMRKQFRASLWREDDWVVAQCLDVDVASQGHSEDEALANLKEALELHFEAPSATAAPNIRPFEVEVSAA